MGRLSYSSSEDFDRWTAYPSLCKRLLQGKQGNYHALPEIVQAYSAARSAKFYP